MTTVATIVARGGSKRLPGKNIMDFCGRPLIAWTIIQARACKGIDGVYVTTDSEEIADIAQEYGAIVFMREDPRESFDETTGGVPTYFAYKKIRKIYPIDGVFHLFSTSPLRKPGHFDQLLQIYKENGHQAIDNFVVIKDAYINKKIDSHTCQQLIQSKGNDYLYNIGGSGMVSPRYFESATNWPETHTTWEDPTTWPVRQEMEPVARPVYYFLLEPWQGYEIDYQSDFDICMFFFEHYLLAEWEAIYERLSERK